MFDLKNEVCDYVTDIDTFTSTVTGESFKINQQLNCDDRCIIYLLTCKQCQKQYTGETTDDFRYRWNNYKSDSRKFNRKEYCMQEHFYIDTLVVQVAGDSLTMYQLHQLTKPMNQIDPKKREDYWMKTFYVDLNYCSFIFGFRTRLF